MKDLILPNYMSPWIPRSTGQMKLVLDNQPIPLDDSIPTYGRTGKKDYKEVQYNKEYQPPEFTDPGSKDKHVMFKDTVDHVKTPTEKANKPTEPRRSARLKDQARTKWKPNRIAQLMLSTVANVFLVSNCIHAEPAKPLLAMENSTRIHQVKAIPLSKDDKDEKLRAYHARLDVLNCIFQPQEDIYGWQVEHIDKHLIKKEDDKVNIFFKVIWFGGNKQWVHMDDLRLHDPFLLIRYALKHRLMDKPGWEWTKHYVESNPELTRMVKTYKVSRENVTIKFGVEVPSSTKAALNLDLKNGDNKWKEAMKSEIDSINAYKTFRVLKDNEPIPPEYKCIPYHCIYDVNFLMVEGSADLLLEAI